jgi:hypothetical protein
VAINEGHLDEANDTLQTRIVPLVRQSPGVVAGYWLAPAEGHGHSMIVFDTEENAKAAAEMARNSPTPEFVKFDSIQVHEIIAKI